MTLETPEAPPAATTRPRCAPSVRMRLGLAFLFAGVTIIVCCNRGFNADKAPSPRVHSSGAMGPDVDASTSGPDATATAATAATPTPEPTEVIIDEKLYEQGVRSN